MLGSVSDGMKAKQFLFYLFLFDHFSFLQNCNATTHAQNQEIFNNFTPMASININSSELIAEKLLEIEAVKLSPKQPFKWASGWNSPIYCDNRLTLSYPDIRTIIKKEFVRLIKETHPDVQAIAGVATAGIPQGALIADALNLPFLYVRASAKSHGLENRVEGKVSEGLKVVVVEDLVSTGGSSISAVEALRLSKAEVLGLVAIFSYGFNVADENFAKVGLKVKCLCDYAVMIDEAKKRNYVSEDDLESLRQWRQSPSTWSV
jgi:orotate phosphoribosyltransferase